MTLPTPSTSATLDWPGGKTLRHDVARVTLTLWRGIAQTDYSRAVAKHEVMLEFGERKEHVCTSCGGTGHNKRSGVCPMAGKHDIAMAEAGEGLWTWSCVCGAPWGFQGDKPTTLAGARNRAAAHMRNARYRAKKAAK